MEVVPRWHTLAYTCILLGFFGNEPLSNMGNGDSCDLEIESKGDGCVFNIYENAHVIVYLQIGEVLVGLTSKTT